MMIQTYFEMIQVSESVLTVCTMAKYAAFCALHRDHFVPFMPDADRDMVYGRESKDIIGLLWKPGVPYPGSNQYDMLHLG